jgi:hypothetical protein
MAMQPAVKLLLDLSPKLTSDLDQAIIDQAVGHFDALQAPLSYEDAAGLLSLLPADGDDCLEINWTIIHAVEHAAFWPAWDLLDEQDPESEWVRILRLRLRNAGLHR